MVDFSTTFIRILKAVFKKGQVLILLAGLCPFFATTALAAEPPSLTIYYYHQGQASPIPRDGMLGGNPQTDAVLLLEALLAGPSGAEQVGGLVSALPAGTKLVGVSVDGQEVTVDLQLPLTFLRQGLDETHGDEIVEQIVKTLHPLGLLSVHVRAADESGEFVPLSTFLPRLPAIVPTVPPNEDPLPDRGGVAPLHAGQPPVYGQGQPQGALSGKTVWLSSGHGWYWSSTLKRWTTQRGNNHGLVEDFSNAEAVNYYLARYLWNAGADVWFARERSMSNHEIIIDNFAGAPAYVETGTWLLSTTPGYQNGTYRWANSAGDLTATVTWTPTLPEAGWYAVWAWYRHGDNRSTDARYQIHHAGGVTTVSISQEVHGMTWRCLGEYYFEAGTAGNVILVNQSDDTGQAVVADAIRFGGGLGSIAEPGGSSGRPRWEEAGRYWAQYQGAPSEITSSDPGSRPRYAEWETAKGYPGEAGNAVYISWHTNAGGGTGSESYIHDTEPTPGSAKLQYWVHNELVRDLRLAWNPNWVDRGRKKADFAEVRELSTMPGTLLEVAFHDTETPGDADDLREPVFRQVAARAVYQGIVSYFADRDGQAALWLPEPPTRLVARNTNPGQVKLTWEAPPCCNGLVGHVATTYKVYQTTDGLAFDDGIQTDRRTLTLTDLPPGSLRFFRVTALNEGGESFPTSVVAVRTPPVGDKPAFLIVDGFDRLDQTAMIARWEAPFLGTVQRMQLERMNRYGYAVEHGQALAACGLAFDSALNGAVERGDVALADYAAVDWFVGQDSEVDAALSDAERARLAAYLDGGGRLLISGAEMGYDMVEQGRDPAFYLEYLRAGYLGDNAGTHSAVGVTGGPFEGLTVQFGEGSDGTYSVEYPDRLAATAGSAVVLTYNGGTGDGAAVAHKGSFGLVHFGFPLEAVPDVPQRTALFCAAADYLLPKKEPADDTCTPRLINPGFEGGRGQTAWQISQPGPSQILARRQDLPSGVTPQEGEWLAWLGPHSPAAAVTMSLAQTVALPAGEPMATLRLAWFAHRFQTASSPADSFSIAVLAQDGTLLAELASFPGAESSAAWNTEELDLSTFAGQTVQLQFRAMSSATAFFLDDVQITTCGPSGADEFRALWVDAFHDGIKSRQQVDELIETVQAANLNALVVQVRRRGDTYYPSAVDPWAPDADRSFDALAYLIEQAHAAGIEIHAWAPALAIWSADAPPSAAGHAFNRHGPGSTGRDYWLMTSFGGTERAGDEVYYLDPGHPDVVEYTVQVYAELVERYDLDGLHLDRIRYPARNWGYNPAAVARFQAQTGRSDRPDPADSQWQQWRRDQVTALVRKIYLTVTAMNPHLTVSAALSSAGSPPSASLAWETRVPYADDLQDWRAWLEEGILDLALPMVYKDQDVYAGQFNGWVEWAQDHQYDRGLVVGTGLYLNSLADSMTQWQRVRQPSALGHQALGVCGYSYATPSDEGAPHRTFANTAVDRLFVQPAKRPALPWKDTPAKGHLMGTLVQPAACLNLDGYPVSLTGPALQGSRTLQMDGQGWFGSVDLLPGQYTLTIDLMGVGRTVQTPVSVQSGVVTQQRVTLPGCSVQNTYLPQILR